MAQMKEVTPRGKGRPRSFDREKALSQALDVFWRRGYETSSLTELCHAMGINAPSLYAAFGNKASLFLEAVQFYETTYWEAPSKKLMAEPDIYRAIADFFADSARILLAPHCPCGCMVVLAAINISDDAYEVREAIKQLRIATKDMFVERLAQAVKSGQLDENTDIVALAGAFNSMLEGLSLQARDGITQSELESIAAFAVRMLPSIEDRLP